MEEAPHRRVHAAARAARAGADEVGVAVEEPFRPDIREGRGEDPRGVHQASIVTIVTRLSPRPIASACSIWYRASRFG